VRLAIVAAPPLALVAIVTFALVEIALTRGAEPRRDEARDSSPPEGCRVRAPEPPPPPATCSTAHTLIVHGHVDGGASHIHLAGPILYTDVATDLFGDFYLSVPVDGDVCDLLTQPTSYVFGQDVSYTITFE
jgi:hypothetical protein